MENQPPSPDSFLGPHGQELRYDYLRGLLGGKPYQMRLAEEDARLVVLANDQGFDSRQQECDAPARGDLYYPDEGHLMCVVSAESFPVLLRRLCETKWDNQPDEDRARDLVTNIISQLEGPDEP